MQSGQYKRKERQNSTLNTKIKNIHQLSTVKQKF